MKLHLKLTLLLCLLLMFACTPGGSTEDGTYATDQSKPEINDWIVVHQLIEPDMLLPTHYATVSSDILCNQLIFQGMMQYDPHTLEPRPILAQSRPRVSNDGLQYSFTIRQNAQWDNGSPVTAQDYITTLKIIRNPAVNTRLVHYLDFIKDVIPDPNDPKTFTVITHNKGVNNEIRLSDFMVLPAFVYDPEGIMNAFTLTQLQADYDKLADHPEIQRFAKSYLSEKHKREKEFVSGSGPYALGEWITGQQVSLERKQDWWGDQEQDSLLTAWPRKLVFKTVKDQNAAVMDLKAGRLDLMYAIKPNTFQSLEQNAEVVKNYQLLRADMFSLSFLGMNMKPGGKRKPFFTDAKVRKALAHLLDVNKAIESFIFGYARRINGPVPFLKTDEYNDTLPFTEFNIQEARRLLKEAGWEDTNGNGTIDKVINGKRTEFEFEFAYGQSVEVRKNIGLMFAEDARKAGIKINVTGYENPVLVEKMASHDLDMMYFTLSLIPGPTDLKEQFHTSSWLSGGFNFMGFGTPETDAIIDALPGETDPEKRRQMIFTLQEIIHAESPCIFLFSSQNLMAVHRRIQNVQTTVVRPSFILSRMWVPQNLTRYGQ
jgi:peptide/nickel transport system substrate-binding protein